MGDYITTFTGKHFYPTDPDPSAICMEDIAHALPMICRGNGHVHSFWSVAEHSICCAKEARARGFSNKIILACLLHDASECYKLLSMIFKQFLNSDLTETEWEAVKTIDNAMLWYDLEELLNEKQPGDPPEIHIKLDYTVRPFEEVEEEYRRLFYRSREDSRFYKG